MKRYLRYEKYQKCYLGQPVDPPEYKKGEMLVIKDFNSLEECENIKEESEATKENVAIIA